jgi:hypothetical protein
MPLGILTIGQLYYIHAKFGASGRYTLCTVYTEKTKPEDVMYLFIDSNGNKVGFINRLYKNYSIEISPINDEIPIVSSALPEPSFIIKNPSLGRPSENRDFWDNNFNVVWHAR